MSTRAQRKSGTSKPRKKTASKATDSGKKNGAGKERAVGTVVQLSKDDTGTVGAAKAPLDALYMQIGIERNRFLQLEARLMNAAKQASEKYSGVVQTIGSKHGIDSASKQSWNFDENAMTFTRTA